MTLIDTAIEMSRRRSEAEETMCRTFCETFGYAPQDCEMQLREMPDGTTEYWLRHKDALPILMGKALPLEHETRDGNLVVRQTFYLPSFGQTAKVTL